MTQWGPTHSPDYPRLMAVIVAVCGAGALSTLGPAVEHTAAAALIAGLAGRLTVRVLRRERRIRARMADRRTLRHPHHPRHETAGPVEGSLRAGPGEQSPAPPVSSARPPASRATTARMTTFTVHPSTRIGGAA